MGSSNNVTVRASAALICGLFFLLSLWALRASAGGALTELESFIRSSDPLEKHDLAMELGRQVCVEATDVLKDEILRDHEGRTLDYEDGRAIIGCIRALGLLAARSEEAWDFLLSATTEAFWEQHITWQGALLQGENRYYYVLGATIHAIGMSGRSEVPLVLMELRERDMSFQREFCNMILSSRYMYYLRTVYGMDGMFQRLAHDTSGGNQAWQNSNDGREWRDWRASLREGDE